MLSEAFVYRMRDFGEMIDVDEFGWPVLSIDEIPHMESAAEQPPTETMAPDQEEPPLDKEAVAAGVGSPTASATRTS